MRKANAEAAQYEQGRAGLPTHAARYVTHAALCSHLRLLASFTYPLASNAYLKLEEVCADMLVA